MDIPLQKGCLILSSHPSGLMALHKEAGIASHPNRPGVKEKSLIRLPYDFEQEAYVDDGKRWYLLNRLDAPTSGVILLADSSEVANAAKAAFASHAVCKSYVALVKGVPRQRKDSWRDCLTTHKREGALRTRVVRGRPNAETEIRLLKQSIGGPPLSLLQLLPVTGRTHQLRVQCASRHLPIVGDATYGDFGFNRRFREKSKEKRLFLHSWRTELKIKVDGETIEFSAESSLPDAFEAALQ